MSSKASALPFQNLLFPQTSSRSDSSHAACDAVCVSLGLFYILGAVFQILCFFSKEYCCLGFPGGSDNKESACSAGDQVRSLGWEDPLEKGMATFSSILT